MTSIPNKNRYDDIPYNRCGNSGLKLPAVSLGLWQNFGEANSYTESKKIALKAFDLGITHFDLANNYGPPAGAAESFIGKLLNYDLQNYRDELVISTKAGYYMWEGPYGEWGSKKYMIASLDQSLKRMDLDYVDIFYSHRPDPDTPLEETMEALAQVVHQGKALYVGVSNYSVEQTVKSHDLLKSMGVRCLIHQPKYSMLNRWVEDELLDTLSNLGMGCIAFSPLAQGLLTNKYLKDIPKDSRAMNEENPFLQPDAITDELRNGLKQLNAIAGARGQSLAQMALSWVLRSGKITSVLIGASRPEQVEENVEAAKNIQFDVDEEKQIDTILSEMNANE